MQRLKILLADDHRIVSESLKRLLEDHYDVVGIVEDGSELIRMATKLQPDILVVDISMPVLNGFEAVQLLKKEGHTAKVIFLTMHADISYASRALEVGAYGYVLKHSSCKELLTALTVAQSGKKFITPVIAEKLGKKSYHRKSPLRKLTSRQRQVLQLLAEGCSAKEVADRLCVSPRTVEFHKYRIMEEVGLQTSAELVHFAVKHGIVTV